MKRLLCLLLALLLLSGCGPQSLERNDTVVQFYYETKEPDFFSSLGSLGYEKRTLSDAQNNLEDMMRLYLSGPIDQGLYFPQGLRLIRWETPEEEFAPLEVTLTFDDSLAELSGIRLRLVCACIARTLWEFRGYETVRFRTQTRLLDDQEYLSIRPGRLVLEDHSAGQPSAMVTLYFSDRDGRYLIGEQRSASENESEKMEEQIVHRLLEGPNSDSLRPTIPPGTMLLNVSLVNGICMVNFSEEFLANRPETSLEERMTVFSVVNSLAQLEDVDAVDIRVEGRKLDRYLYLNLSGELLPDDRMIGPVRAGVGEFDATLYVCLEGSEQLAAFPVRIREAVDLSRVGPVMDELCGFTAENGYSSPATDLVKSHEEYMENGVLQVMLTTDPAEDDQLRLLERSVIATMRELPEVRTIRLFINGREIPRGSDPYRSDWLLN